MVSSPADRSDHPLRTLRAIAVPAYGPTLLESLGLGAVLPVIVAAALELGAGLEQASLLVVAISVGPIIADLPIGALVARVGERRALAGAGVVTAAGMAAAAMARSVPALAAALLLVGMANAVFGLARQAYLIAAVPVGLRARALSTLGGSHRIGNFIGPFFGALVIGVWGTGAAFALAAVTALGASVVVLVSPDLTVAARPRTGPAPSVLSVVRRHVRVLLTTGVGGLFIALARGARVALVPLWAAHLGMGAAATSLVVGISGAIELLLVYPAGAVMDRRGRHWVAVPAMIGIALSLLALPLTSGPASLTVVAASLGLSNGMSSGLVMTMAADVAPEDTRVQFLGAWRLLADGGAALGPVLVSVVASAASLAAAAVAAGAVTLVGAGWLVRHLPRPAGGGRAVR